MKGKDMKATINQAVSIYTQYPEVFALALRFGFEKPVYLGKGMFAIVAAITPTMATKILELCTDNRNRKLKYWSLETFKDAMRRGEFRLTHQGIAFNSSGILVDGQHRLNACVATSTTIECVVTFRSDNVGDFDGGCPRTAVDNLGYEGIESQRNIVSALRWFVRGGDTRRTGLKMQTSQLVRADAACGQAVRFAISVGSSLAAPGVAAIARADFYCDRDKLTRFAKVATTLTATSESESAAIAYGRWRAKHKDNSADYWRQVFLRAMHCIKCFDEGKPIASLRDVETEVYPVPQQLKEAYPQLWPK